ncbi:tetratricopeptide repeat protein [Nonomuraea sp. KC401]|uniref:BTAD domain-containing putative transcriptional regulator n=1 Tax=unclassified Nonomuraea TaxID=2593643 RepID=UPI0010FD427E|nr:BTAD domain-containing putative transcriptional regulator [Nonomuraea sp. KC401]NBE98434.1 tetratricopeptide repeat protein [Nonomuraea sp. K271]TLF60987.1 tetratricopeptide repeat protein [Nonomuraea sp. KC401]
MPEAKVRALLAALLANPGRVVSADRLADELWDRPPAHPVRAVQTLVSRLRAVLGAEAVLRRPPGYLLNAEDETVDAVRFVALADRARAAGDPREQAEMFSEALGLWRGQAFDGFADEPFARAAAARLEEQRLLAWEDYAEARLELGDHGPLVSELAELTRGHPLRERLRAAHMRALYGAGRASAALDVFQDARRVLNEDLGLEPGPGLIELQQQILRQEFTGRPPQGNLPEPLTDLIGRSRAAADVRGLLNEERLVTLTGPGGVGKTRLALEVGHAQAEAFPDGVWLVELGGERPHGERISEAVAFVLGLRDEPSPSGVSHRLAEALRGRRLLLVLDNCEHVIDAVAGLAGLLLRRAPGVRVLATSREPLGIAGERQWPVPPLDVPEAGAGPQEVAQSSAVRLFVARAAAASPGFAVSAENAEAVATICRRMDGIPLALELASTRVRVLGTTELAHRLDDRFGLLVGGRRDAPARQRTLKAVIDWSWNLLTGAERAVLGRLAIHRDGCALEAAEALCSGRGVKPAEVVDLLASLVNRSLLVVTGDDPPRYRLLESVAAYCLEKLPEDEHEALRQAHARYYVSLAERADAHLRGGDQQRWLRRLDAEAANLRAALDTADEHLTRRLVRRMAWYWLLRGRFAEARRSLALALETDDDGAWLAGMTLLTGEPWRGRPPVEASGRARWFLGYAETLFGSLEAAEELNRRALDDFRDKKDRWGIAASLTVRGLHRYVRGDIAGSRLDAEEGLALFTEARDQWGRLQAIGVLGRLAEIVGDYHAAEVRHREGLALAESLDLWGEVSVRWSELGRIALLSSDFARADKLHERGRRLAVTHADRRAQEFAEVGLALAARRQGRLDEAEKRLRAWLDWNREFDAENGAALILAELGFVAEQRGDAPAALELHEQGLAAASATGDPRAVALAYEGLAGAHSLAGRHEEAARLLNEAFRLRESVGAPLPPAERGDVDRITAVLRTALGTLGP